LLLLLGFYLLRLLLFSLGKLGSLDELVRVFFLLFIHKLVFKALWKHIGLIELHNCLLTDVLRLGLFDVLGRRDELGWFYCYLSLNNQIFIIAFIATFICLFISQRRQVLAHRFGLFHEIF
jgi:hypothetical protein